MIIYYKVNLIGYLYNGKKSWFLLYINEVYTCLQAQKGLHTYLHSTAVAWREKICQHFVFYRYFSLVLALLKSRISEKTIKTLLNKLDFKLFHYKARVQPVNKITTVATRNRFLDVKIIVSNLFPMTTLRKKVPTFFTNIELYGQEW